MVIIVPVALILANANHATLVTRLVKMGANVSKLETVKTALTTKKTAGATIVIARALVVLPLLVIVSSANTKATP